MKPFYIAILAVIVAVSAVAFKPYSKTADQHVFEYNGDYSKASIENLSNWTYVGDNLALCSNVDKKACRIRVTDASVDDPENPSELDPMVVTITASNAGTKRYVTAITGLNNIFSNQPE